MKSILNGLFLGLKYILFVGALCLSLYIILGMYKRLDKNIMEAIPIFIPYFLILVLFVINIIARQKSVNGNLFYNVTCCLAFLTILFICYRTLYDTNMIYHIKLGKDINFVYFNDFISYMKILLIGICASNIFLMFNMKEKPKVEEEIL